MNKSKFIILITQLYLKNIHKLQIYVLIILTALLNAFTINARCRNLQSILYGF